MRQKRQNEREREKGRNKEKEKKEGREDERKIERMKIREGCWGGNKQKQPLGRYFLLYEGTLTANVYEDKKQNKTKKQFI